MSKQSNNTCLFVKPPKELKAKTMRAEMSLGLFLFCHTTNLCGVNVHSFGKVFQYFVKTNPFWWAIKASDRLESCAVSCSIRPRYQMLSLFFCFYLFIFLGEVKIQNIEIMNFRMFVKTQYFRTSYPQAHMKIECGQWLQEIAFPQ